jgi:transposase
LIESGRLAVFFQDECHLLWGDLCGYVWGKTHERVEMPMQNQKERQTYFGAVNLATGECLIQPQPTGNGLTTIEYLKYLMEHCPGQQIALIWDGAGYHRSGEMKEFLASVNDGLAESEWKITCLRFAPNDPTQNPIEDIWLAAKRYIREFYHQCKTFTAVKCLFELAVQHQIFDFPKLDRLGKFSLII